MPIKTNASSPSPFAKTLPATPCQKEKSTGLGSKTDKRQPLRLPKMMTFSQCMVSFASCSLAIIRETNPKVVSRAITPAAVAPPKISPATMMTVLLRNIQIFSSPCPIFYDRSIYILLILAHFHLDRCRIMGQFLLAKMVIKE